MEKMTSLERVLTTIRHKEPDRVPTFESDIDENVRNKIKPGLSYEDFVEYMDLDAIVYFDMAGQKYETLNDKGYVKDQWGAIRRFTPGSLLVPYPVETPIKSEKYLDDYVPPDPDLPWRYEILEKNIRRFKGKRAVIATVMDPFQTVRDCLRGLDQYLMDMVEKPDLVDRLNEIARDYHRRYVKNCISAGADIIWMTGDIATSQGPFISPKLTERFIVPGIRQIADIVHGSGLPFLKHTDGNIMKIMDMLIDAGVDAIHPIDPVAGMNLGEVKAKYGNRVCLMGNVDCAHLLTWGTTEEVRASVKECIRQAGKGGGYICTTSNTVHSAVKPENYAAMLEAIKEYGKYPISV
jgi:uroporphyrinogen decarboxylase